MKVKATEQFGLVGVIVTLGILAGLSLFVDMEVLKSYVVNAGAWAPIVFILLKISTVVIAPLGGGPIYPLVGAFFGFWPGILYVAIGDLIGLTVAFWLSRTFGYPLVERMTSKGEHKLLRKIVDHAGTTRGFLQMIMAFFAMPELIAYGTGLSRYPYLAFIVVLWPLTLVGSSILVFIGSSLGASGGSILFSVAVPVAATFVMALGVWFFFKSLKKD